LEGVTETFKDGGDITSKGSVSTEEGVPDTIIVADIFWAESFWFALTVVQETEEVEEEKDFCNGSSTENPEGNVKETVPEPDSPETATVNAMPCITVPGSEPG